MKIAFPLRMPTRKKRAYRINEISNTSNLVLTIVMTILAICTLIPVLLVVSVSLSSEEALSHGYKLIPEEFSLEAYTVLFKTGQSMATVTVSPGSSWLMYRKYAAPFHPRCPARTQLVSLPPMGRLVCPITAAPAAIFSFVAPI